MSRYYSSPPDTIEYYLKVWDLVRQIPAGKVATYGQIASMITSPEIVDPQTYKSFSPRWVGSAMAACPDDVPWQRVINAQGKISQRRREGHLLQRQLLEAEGIQFDDRERIDLKRFGWSGPSDPNSPSWEQASLDDLF